MQPGQTITPGSSPNPPEEPVENNELPKQETPEVPAVADTAAAPASVAAEPQSDWQYTADAEIPAQYNSPQAAPAPVTWTASEYISHTKGPGWFMLLGAGLFVLVAVVYLLTKDIFASAGVGVAGITFAVFSARPPRVLDYAITEQGVQIGQRFYPYHDFKSFSVMHDGPLPSILLMPLKRFLPPITVFYEPQSGDAIIDVLSAYLPHESKEPDAVDKLMSRLRF